MKGLVSAVAVGLIVGAGSRVYGQTEPALGYFPVTPCRVVDTRLITSSGSPLVADAPRSFRIKGGDLSDQGGRSTGCGVPGTATAAMLNFVAVTPSGAGHLTAWAYPALEPATPSAILNFGVVTGLRAIANGIAVPICDANTASCFNDFTIKAAASSTHAVVDVVGFFGPTAAGSTSAACSQVPSSSSTCASVCGPGKIVAGMTVGARCDVTSDTGSCFAIGCQQGCSPLLWARCCVCRP